jgi:arylsulfatase A-like enzyme
VVVAAACAGLQLLALVGCGVSGEPGAAPTAEGAALLGVDPPAHVLLVVVDTLRVDSVSFTAGAEDLTPFMGRLAQRGVVFTNAYAPSSWTKPSMASLHTSLYPTSHGVVSGELKLGPDGKGLLQPVLSDSFTTLAETFQTAGYATVGLPANRHLASQQGFAQGFDHYYQQAKFYHAKALNRIARGYLRQAFGGNWTRRFGDRRSFVWLHYFDPHDPYAARLPWIRYYAPDFFQAQGSYPTKLPMREIKERYPRPDAQYRDCALPLYHNEIRYWDEQFRRFADELGVEGGNVLVVFTSDHGEEFVDHGGVGHSHTLYEELVHVPLLFYWPSGLAGGRRIDAPVSLLDIYPTLTELAGIAPPPGLQGRSLVPLLRGERGDPGRVLLYELKPPMPVKQAIRRERFKLVRSEEPTGPALELFDLARDPGEQDNVAASQPDVARALLRELEDALAALPAAPEIELRESLDPELIKQLENMGSVEGEDLADGGGADGGRQDGDVR